MICYKLCVPAKQVSVLAIKLSNTTCAINQKLGELNPTKTDTITVFRLMQRHWKVLVACSGPDPLRPKVLIVILKRQKLWLPPITWTILLIPYKAVAYFKGAK